MKMGIVVSARWIVLAVAFPASVITATYSQGKGQNERGRDEDTKSLVLGEAQP